VFCTDVTIKGKRISVSLVVGGCHPARRPRRVVRTFRAPRTPPESRRKICALRAMRATRSARSATRELAGPAPFLGIVAENAEARGVDVWRDDERACEPSAGPSSAGDTWRDERVFDAGAARGQSSEQVTRLSRATERKQLVSDGSVRPPPRPSPLISVSPGAWACKPQTSPRGSPARDQPSAQRPGGCVG